MGKKDRGTKKRKKCLHCGTREHFSNRCPLLKGEGEGGGEEEKPKESTYLKVVETVKREKKKVVPRALAEGEGKWLKMKERKKETVTARPTVGEYKRSSGIASDGVVLLDAPSYMEVKEREYKEEEMRKYEELKKKEIEDKEAMERKALEEERRRLLMLKKKEEETLLAAVRASTSETKRLQELEAKERKELQAVMEASRAAQARLVPTVEERLEKQQVEAALHASLRIAHMEQRKALSEFSARVPSSSSPHVSAEDREAEEIKKALAASMATGPSPREIEEQRALERAIAASQATFREEDSRSQFYYSASDARVDPYSTGYTYEHAADRSSHGVEEEEEEDVSEYLAMLGV